MAASGQYDIQTPGINTSQKGFTLMELLVTLMLSSVIAAMGATQFFNTTQTAHDELVIMKTEGEARAIMDLLSFELRMMGAGMPLTQVGFDPSDLTLGGASLPIFIDATATSLTFRLNEKGDYTVLTTDYTPSGFGTTIDVADSSDFAVGDFLYISNLRTGSEEGMYAEVDSISGNQISVDAAYIATAGATFEEGSTVQRVTDVTLTSGNTFSAGIIRITDTSTVTVADSATFSIDYRDPGGNSMTLPMTEADIANSLHALQLIVQKQSSKVLRDGSNYVATVQQTVMLRNLVISR